MAGMETSAACRQSLVSPGASIAVQLNHVRRYQGSPLIIVVAKYGRCTVRRGQMGPQHTNADRALKTQNKVQMQTD